MTFLIMEKKRRDRDGHVFILCPQSSENDWILEWELLKVVVVVVGRIDLRYADNLGGAPRVVEHHYLLHIESRIH